MPFIVVGTVGTTSSLAIDPIDAIADVCERHDIWLHVDAAMAGAAAVVPELRALVNDGLERVDSWCFDPHKWLLTNFDCDVLYLADRKPLINSLSVLPEYLRNQASESGAVIDYRDWHIPLGRRFRALKLWFVIRHYGAEGLRDHIEKSVASARWFARTPSTPTTGSNGSRRPTCRSCASRIATATKQARRCCRRSMRADSPS